MRVPAIMKAIVVHQFGLPSVLQLHEVSVPIPGEGQALIRLHAIGVNFSDTERRRGMYAAPRLPWRPGSEGAGVVVDVGANVERSWMDRRVAFWAMPPAVSGAYAEFALAPVEALMDLGDDINFETGAALPLQGLTAYGLAIRAVDIRPGQIVLVHSAAGGVGQILVQIARLKGARVIGTASSVEKCNAIQRLKFKYKKQHRLPGYDYSQAGGYFVTIVVKDRMKVLGKIENDHMLLSDVGKIAGKYWTAIPSRYQSVALDEWVVMPDHIHGIIIIKENLGGRELSSGGINTSGNDSSEVDLSENDLSGNVPRHVPTNPTNPTISNTDIQFPDIQFPEIHCQDQQEIPSLEIPFPDIHSPVVPSSGIHPLIKNSLSSIINHYKGDVKKWCNRNGFPGFQWQSRFHDRVIRNDLEFFRIRQYIKDNPKNWKK